MDLTEQPNVILVESRLARKDLHQVTLERSFPNPCATGDHVLQLVVHNIEFFIAQIYVGEMHMVDTDSDVIRNFQTFSKHSTVSRSGAVTSFILINIVAVRNASNQMSTQLRQSQHRLLN